MVRLMLLERLLQHLPQLHSVGGVRAIPYMQVILMLTADLDGDDEKDKGALDDLLAQLIGELGMHKKVSKSLVSFPIFLFYKVNAENDLNLHYIPKLYQVLTLSFSFVSIQDVSKKNERSPVNEVHLVIMRLLSVFMSRTKSGSKPSSEVF